MSIHLAILRPAPLSKRLWQGGGIVAAVVLTIVAVNFVLPAEKSVGRTMLGHDFLAFYAAGTAVREGHFDRLYDLDWTREFQAEVGRRHGLELGEGFGPFWNPPFYALLFVPLAGLSYDAAVSVWVTINILCVAGAIALLARLVADAAGHWPWFHRGVARGSSTGRYWLLVPLLVCCSMPFLQALSHGQNTFLSLFLLTGTVLLWRARRGLAAGAVCGLMFYKPQLALIIAAMLTLTLGWRALAGLVLSGLVLLLVSELVLPDTLQMYAAQLPLNLAFMQVESPYLWERHATLKSFWRLLLDGRGAGEMSQAATIAWAGTWALVALGLTVVAWRAIPRHTSVDDPFTNPTRAVRLDRAIAATFAAMPLLMPFYFDYDLLLLSIPLTLVAVERIRDGRDPLHHHDRTLIKSAAILYFWLMFNPGIARASGINVTVVLLSAIAGLLIARALRDEASTIVLAETEAPRLGGSVIRLPDAALPLPPRPIAA